MRFIKPLDYGFLDRVGRSCRVLMTVEEGAREGGIGEEIAAYFEEKGYRCRVICAGIPDRFIMEDSRSSILRELRLDADGIMERLKPFLSGPAFQDAHALQNSKEKRHAVI